MTHKILCLLSNTLTKKELDTFTKSAILIQKWFAKITDDQLTLDINYQPVTDHLGSISIISAIGASYTPTPAVVINPELIFTAAKRFKGSFDSVCLVFDTGSVFPHVTNDVQFPMYRNGYTIFDVGMNEEAQVEAVAGNSFCHELLHAMTYLINVRGNLSIPDQVHIHAFDDIRPAANFSDIVLNQFFHYYNLLGGAKQLPPPPAPVHLLTVTELSAYIKKLKLKK